MATVEGLLGASSQSMSSAYNQMGMAPALVMQAFAKLLEDMEERKLRRERMDWERQQAPVQLSILQQQLDALKGAPKREEDARVQRTREGIERDIRLALTTQDPEARKQMIAFALTGSDGLPEDERKDMKARIKIIAPETVAERNVSKERTNISQGITVPEEERATSEELAGEYTRGRVPTKEFRQMVPGRLTPENRKELLMHLSSFMRQKMARVGQYGDLSEGGMRGAEIRPEAGMGEPLTPGPEERAAAAFESYAGPTKGVPSYPTEYGSLEYARPRAVGTEPKWRVVPGKELAELTAGLKLIGYKPKDIEAKLNEYAEKLEHDQALGSQVEQDTIDKLLEEARQGSLAPPK